jgi:putative ABC transport system permease protein
VLLVVAVVTLTPQVIGRMSRIVAWPLERDGRILGRLARENAARNPARTAVSAASLMIGLALVLFVTVYATGLRTSTGRIIDRTVLGDFTIESQDGTSLIPAAAARAASAAPGLASVSTLKTATAALGTSTGLTATGIDPTTIDQVYKFDWLGGAAATAADLTFGDVVVERDTARAAHLKVGDQTTVRTETGRRLPVTVRGIYRDTALLHGFALPLAQFDQVFHQERLEAVLVKLLPDADRGAAGAALDNALGAFPGVVSRSQQQLRDKISGRVNSILILFYALLAMSVLMSLLGIINTLNLSIHERTRELAVLRAVGMTPGQTRALIRNEALITAAVGTLIGVCLGLFLAWIVTRALTDEGIVFAVPWLQVIVVCAVGIAAGVAASIPPAARAARLDLLAAIAHE